MKIVPLKTVALEAWDEIKSFRDGEKKYIKTGRPYLDDVFPVIPGSIIVIAAGSGVGKSYELAEVADNIMDTSINIDADKFVLLSISLEMKVRSLVLRGMSKRTAKSKRSILENVQLTDEEQAILAQYKKSLKDPRYFISQDPMDADGFYTSCREFILANTAKELIVIALDHLALIGGDGKQASIERFIENTNKLKMEFNNLLFIYLSQLNGEIYKRIREKDSLSQPKDTDLYYSGFIFQVADYVMVKVNPYKMGIQEYSKLLPRRYPSLTNFFTGPSDSKGRRALRTAGVMYYHLLKCREADDSFYTDIFAEDMQIRNMEDIVPVEVEASEDDAPVFKDPMAPVNHNTPGILSASGLEFNTPTFDEAEGDSPF